MSSIKYYIFITFIFLASHAFGGSVCNVEGLITRVIPSFKDVGLRVESATTCNCANSGVVATYIWLDIDQDGGKAMYSAALSAMVTGRTVLATIEDGKGQGSPGNDSVTYRWFLDCQLFALELR